ncbi:DEAD/DEAH box helicase [Thiohalocapsa marina]|uniref:DEAD/DEAH box helicase n=1 Tax=Thiohalocapsa marina TaxID=424902 RepID=A0A5M8FI32_9GAMM|nr:DEAD/DEAH box helicase [Thiohalocapsa marina]KAA6184104.1 DEAD/DEAH box helicase [Thiohalocapsa marina]
MPEIILRDYQAGMLHEVRRAYAKGHRAPLLVAPTGSGKTITFCFIAANASAKGNRTLILVHRRELLSQTSATLDAFGVPHGRIAAGEPETDALVQVASVQTLVRRLERMSWAPDLIVVDEAHHAVSTTGHGRVLAAFPSARVLGVTATPQRLDGRGLGVNAGGFFDAMILGPSVAELIELCYLSRPTTFAPRIALDLSGIRTVGGDYAKVSVAHAEHVAETFRRAGYQAASIDGTLDPESRAARIADLGAGKLNVLTSCEIISEGTDIPIVGAAILLRPTQSLALYLQQGGRALRPFPGKERTIILDHVGNSARHGLLETPRDWALDAPKRTRQTEGEPAAPVRQCDQCGAVHSPAPECPECGFIYPVQRREIEEVAGRRPHGRQAGSRCR